MIRIKFRARTKAGSDDSDANELVFRYERHEGESFSDRKLDRFSAIKSEFTECRFEHLYVHDSLEFGGATTPSHYLACSFDHSYLRADANIGLARFVRCSFRDVHLYKWFTSGADFVECVFSGQLRDCTFDVRPFDHPSVPTRRGVFEGNDFREAELAGVSFRGGIDLSKQLLPEGPRYVVITNAGERLKEALKLVSHVDAALQHQVRLNLQVCIPEVDGGQNELFIDLDLYGGPADPSAAATINLLRGSGIDRRVSD